MSKSITDPSALTAAEQIKLVSGHDYWRTEAIPAKGIRPIQMSDGPHGLRYQDAATDNLGLNQSAPATAFPTASAVANSWDPTLLYQMGQAIANEAKHLGVDVVLGPGVNIKRNPLGGRNFEYFSEDPYLAGTLATAWINGLQDNGVAASLKHFAGNNQESYRLLSNSLIDPQALHELYLEAFRLAVTQAHPATVMAAYNLINGTYMSDHRYLLNDVLRGQWGFKGLVVTDWGGLNDPVKALEAGTDLEMPGDKHYHAPALTKALRTGQLDPIALRRAAGKIIALAARPHHEPGGDNTALLATNADIAQHIAAHSAVLLKNNGALPLTATDQVLVLGEMAAKTRYQGAGSSHINAPATTSLTAGLQAAGVVFDYLPGYQLTGQAAPALATAAVNAARTAGKVIIAVGLPANAETEGMDRHTMALPENQNALIDAVTAVNDQVIVVLVAGAPVELPWRAQLNALLALYLNGERTGAAAAQLLTGAINPSGKLAESYPVTYADVPSADRFGQQPTSVPYAESLYVGYRYYDKANVTVAYPFGFGLSYTTFALRAATLTASTVDRTTPALGLSVTVANTGSRAGETVVQVYVGDTAQARLTPQKALKAFTKVTIPAGETLTTTLTIPQQAFREWAEASQSWVLYDSHQQIFVGTSSRDIAFALPVTVNGPSRPATTSPAWYRQPTGHPTVADFTALAGLRPTRRPVFRPGEYTPMNTPAELSAHSLIVRGLVETVIKHQTAKLDPLSPEAEFMRATVLTTPLVRLAQQTEGALPQWLVERLVALANQPVRQLLKGGHPHGATH